MDWEHCIVALSALGAITFAAAAVRLPEKRMRLAIPILFLVLTVVHESLMIRWESTVHAPVRLDLVLEIPLMFLFLAWGILALALPVRRRQPK